MRTVFLWRLDWGRISTFKTIIAADSFDEASKIAIEWMRQEKPEWNATSMDILSLKRLEEPAVMRSNG